MQVTQILKITLKKASELFPNETWVKKDELIFQAKNRIPKNKQQSIVFEKELKMALFAQKFNHAVCFLPEIKNEKNPDAVLDGMIFEFKNVSGNLDTMAKRFHEAKKQSDNVYIFLEQKFNYSSVYRRLKGEVLDAHYKQGKIFIALNSNFYIIDSTDLKQKNRPK